MDMMVELELQEKDILEDLEYIQTALTMEAVVGVVLVQ
jgi:hypothetical protein